MTISADDKVKREFSAFCSDVGLSASALINVFMVKTACERHVPFVIEVPHIPNAETIDALKEGDRIVDDHTRKRYTSLQETGRITANAISPPD